MVCLPSRSAHYLLTRRAALPVMGLDENLYQFGKGVKLDVQAGISPRREDAP